MSRRCTLVVDLWAPSPVLPVIAPVLQDLGAASRADQVVKVNVDDEPTLGARFDARSIPLLVVMREGREVDRIVGALRAGARGAARARSGLTPVRAPRGTAAPRRMRSVRCLADLSASTSPRQRAAQRLASAIASATARTPPPANAAQLAGSAVAVAQDPVDALELALATEFARVPSQFAQGGLDQLTDGHRTAAGDHGVKTVARRPPLVLARDHRMLALGSGADGVAVDQRLHIGGKRDRILDVADGVHDANLDGPEARMGRTSHQIRV